ncbi:MAG: ATP synthase F1 subunit delta [Pirellulales bacterium]|nr:ATP synthase F1 subunit delta [Pirellulales bacterium]
MNLDNPQTEYRPETVMDTDAQQVGKLYAKAFLGAATKAGQVEELLEELGSLVDDVLDKNVAFSRMFGSQVLPHEEREAMIDRVFRGRASQLMLNFLKTLSRHSRLDALREIRKAAQDSYDQSQGRVKVIVTTALPLEAEVKSAIADAVRQRTGGQPVIVERTRPDLIGGVVVQVGDTVFDGSVAARLRRIRKKMIDRSVHEISSRRDRFRSADGN